MDVIPRWAGRVDGPAKGSPGYYVFRPDVPMAPHREATFECHRDRLDVIDGDDAVTFEQRPLF